jgi:predicted hotdog family 3-hydroxylacyl-ACP dehydratase
MLLDSVLEYIPQRPPFVFVDKLQTCHDFLTQTSFLIKPETLFVENGRFTEMGLLENMAQSCAVYIGYMNNMCPVRIGMVGSVDKFEVFFLPEVGNCIETQLQVDAEVANILSVRISTWIYLTKLASCKMKIVLTDMILKS